MPIDDLPRDGNSCNLEYTLFKLDFCLGVLYVESVIFSVILLASSSGGDEHEDIRAESWDSEGRATGFLRGSQGAAAAWIGLWTVIRVWWGTCGLESHTRGGWTPTRPDKRSLVCPGTEVLNRNLGTLVPMRMELCRSCFSKTVGI